MDDFIRVGLVTRSGVSLSASGEVFASAIRNRCADKSYDDSSL